MPKTYAEALEQCQDILEAIEELPSRAADFGESVATKVRGISDTIELTRRVTENQQEALDNMESGVNRWFKR